MLRWRYKRLMNLGITKGRLHRTKDGGWYVLPFENRSDPTFVLLNPSRDWDVIPAWEFLAWDTESSHADLATEEHTRLGLDGWELVGMHSAYAMFKKPVE